MQGILALTEFTNTWPFSNQRMEQTEEHDLKGNQLHLALSASLARAG